MLTLMQSFNRLAAPILYSEVVVDDPAGLMLGVDMSPEAGHATDSLSGGLMETPDSQHQARGGLSHVVQGDSVTPGRLHKQDLLRTVTALHVVFTWKRTKKDHRAPRPRPVPAPSLDTHGADTVTRLTTSSIAIDTLFPGIERQTNWAWPLPKPPGRRPKIQYVQHSPSRFDPGSVIMSTPSARYTCQRPWPEDCDQPDDYKGGWAAEHSAREEVVCLHDWNLDDLDLCYPIDALRPGIENVVYVDPREYENRPMASQLHEELQSLIESLDGTLRNWSLGSLPESRVAHTRLLLLLPRPTRGSTGQSPFDAVKDLAAIRDLLQTEITDMEAHAPLWSNDGELAKCININWADTRPHCQACGYTCPPADAEDKGWMSDSSEESDDDDDFTDDD